MKKMPRVLIVEDEPAIAELIAVNLRHNGFQPIWSEDGESAQRELDAVLPDVILLDWMLPGRSGLELAQQLKQSPKTKSIPIIMVSARGEEEDRVKGLDTGADDYIAKPFSPREMVARVKAVLRRAKPDEAGDEIEIGGLVMDNLGHRVTADGRPIEVAPTEYRLLHFFMTHADRAFSRSQLLDQVWGDQVYVEERTVDVHIRRLRKALEPTGHDRLLQTVRGVGYRFSDKT